MNDFDDIFENQTQENAQDGRPFDKEVWAKRKQEERQDVYALADSTAEAIAGDGSKFQAYLDVQARFDRYSATNALLILAQMPQATRLKDFDDWKAGGATIKRHQKGISILEPGNEYERADGTVGTSYNVKKVFDISQTTARTRVQPEAGMDERLLLRALIHRTPVPIRMKDSLPGNAGAVYDHEQEVVLVRRGMGARDLFRSVSLALAHAELAFSRDGYSRETAGFPAYCASYLLCRKNGIDVGGYDFSKLPDSLRESDAQGIRNQLSEIRDTAGIISARMNRVLEQGRQTKTREQER